MNYNTKELFEEAYSRYNKYMELSVPDYWERYGFKERRKQCNDLINVFNDIKFPFDKLNVVETGTSCNHSDGMFGLILGFASEQIDGIMLSVDIDEEKLEKSKKLFNKYTPSLDYQIFKEDSVSFLTNLSTAPNLVHLDSWDLNLKDPLPSALHGWRDFIAIESKMESGSLILIDDNYINGTWVDWIYPNGEVERIDVNIPIMGKGALVYHYVMEGESDWKLVGDHYKTGPNIKLILQKK